MLIRNGIKTSLRARGRSILFFFLLAFLTLLFILALGVLLYCGAVMKECDAQYRSIARVEYMGGDYPKADEPDPAARAALASLERQNVAATVGVEAWNDGRTLTGWADGFHRRSGEMPYGDRVVVRCGEFKGPIRQGDSAWYNQFEEARDVVYYTAVIDDAIYARELESGLIIDLLAGEIPFEPEPGKSYVIHGRQITRLQKNHPLNGMRVVELLAFEEADDLPYAEYDPESGVPAAFAEAAQTYSLRNDYIRVTCWQDVEDAYEFQQGELRLAEGAFPDPGVPGGCVVTPDLAEALGLGVGDAFSLDLLAPTEDSLYDLSRADGTLALTVCGITESSYDYYGTVWAVHESADTPLFGYLLGTAALDNAKGEDAAAALRQIVPENVRVTLLDQGYAETVKPFREVRKTAINILLICAAGVLAVLILFAFLYVGRQSLTVRTMVCLGTPRIKVAVWMLSGAFLITGLAAAAGTAGGVYLQPWLIGKVMERVDLARAGERFFLYSETELGVVKQAVFDPQVPLWPNLAAAGAIVLAALLLCRIFLIFAYRGGVLKKGRSRVRVPHGKTSRFGFGPWRFARLSIRRGGLRTLIVPLTAGVLTAIVIFLGGVYQGWVDNLQDVRTNAQIEGNAVSLNGRFYSKLAVPIQTVRALQKVEDVEDVRLSYSFRYWLPEEMPDFGNSGYAQEHRADWIGMQPEIVAVNDLRGAKEFYYSEPNVTWLPGWDETVLKTPDLPSVFLLLDPEAAQPVYPAVLGDEFMRTHGLRLGDELDCMARLLISDFNVEQPVRLKVAGSYKQTGGRNQIFVPLAAYLPPDLLTAEDADFAAGRSSLADVRMTVDGLRNYLGASASFDTCRFRLKTAAHLDALRDELYDAGFSAVGMTRMIRTAVVLNDAGFMKLVESMEQNIAIGRALGVAISALVILLGFLISWLMTNARKPEFALMRGFGASRLRVFLSFFHEQFLLCLFGCLLGSAALYWFYAGGRLQIYMVAGFFACYLLGTVVAIRINSRIKLMELLTVRE